MPGSEVRVIRSMSTDTDYQISVALPYHYDDDPDKVWPVIYLLDGNLYFGLVVDMVRAMNIRVDFCNELPDAFIVGIGYSIEGSLSAILHDVMHRRCTVECATFSPTAIRTRRSSSRKVSLFRARLWRGRRQHSGRSCIRSSFL